MDILERLDPFTATPQDISDAYNEIERLRDENKILFAAVSLFQIEMHNALFALEKTVDDIQQKDSE